MKLILIISSRHGWISFRKKLGSISSSIGAVPQSYINNDLTEVIIQIKIYLLYLDAIVQFLRFVYEDLHTSLSIMKIFFH